MKYLITHLKETNPILGTVWETLDCPKLRTEIIEGILELNNDTIIIYKTTINKIAEAIGDYPIRKHIIFCASSQNITLQIVPEPENDSNLTSNISSNLTEN